jgi:hypothetical protein
MLLGVLSGLQLLLPMAALLHGSVYMLLCTLVLAPLLSQQLLQLLLQRRPTPPQLVAPLALAGAAAGMCLSVCVGGGGWRWWVYWRGQGRGVGDSRGNSYAWQHQHRHRQLLMACCGAPWSKAYTFFMI